MGRFPSTVGNPDRFNPRCMVPESTGKAKPNGWKRLKGMMHPFSSYEAYIERYKMFWSEEGDGRPPILSETDFRQKYQLLRESYRTYWEMIQSGKESEAAHYYLNIINPLENELAIADGADNFLLDDEHR